MNTLDKFHAVRDDLNSVLIERESAVDNALIALASRQHYLMLGPTGTAKSLLVNELQRRIDGAQKFITLVTAFSAMEDIFGPIDLIGMSDRGEYKRIASNMLQTAHVAMLDEIWKSNPAILNALLWITNERLMFEPGMDRPEPVPLLSLFAASNETPQDDSLTALNDRFTLREVVNYIQDDNAYIRMLTAPEPPDPQATLDLDDIRQAQLEVLQIKGTPETLQAIVQIKHQLSSKGILVSDRKGRAQLKVVKTHAWLDGRPETTLDDVCSLAHVLWTDPAERKTVEQIVYQNVSPLIADAIETEDLAAEICKDMPQEGGADERDRLENILQQLDDMLTDLRKRAERSGTQSARIEQALDRIANHHNQAAMRYRAFMRRLGIKTAAGDF